MSSTVQRRRSRFHRAIGTLSAACALVVGAGFTASATDIHTVTDTYLYRTSLSQFAEIRNDRPHGTELDWSSDACSYSPDKPLGYDFTYACNRHDFGYRNYKKQERFNSINRKRIDDVFLVDMRNLCSGHTTCNAAAWTYYTAVRAFGAS